MDRLANPMALWLLVIPVALGFIYFLKARKLHSKHQLALALPETLLRSETRRTRWVFRTLFVLSLCAFGMLAYVIARPFTLDPKITKKSEGIDIVVVFDVSESMDAEDFTPNRITVAKAVLRDFVRRRSQDRVGIVLFSGDAVTKCPLTNDNDFLLSMVDDIRLRELKQGTAIGMGLANGIVRLKASEAKTKVLILMTDGDSNVGAINPITAANLARQEGIKIYTIGIGKSNRVVVPIYAYDAYGRRTQLVAQVPSYLNPDLLRDIALKTGGKWYMARDPGMLSRMLQEIDRLERTKIKVTRTENRKEEFTVPALLASILLALVCLLQESRFRRARLA